jgi:glycosyltransferase involved in cell wall biosynthesis
LHLVAVQILIAAYLDSIYKVPGVLETLPSDTPVVIVHQVPSGKPYEYERIFARNRLEVVRMDERGLAKSRNRGLFAATEDFLIPTDDDVRFLEGAPNIVERSFLAKPDADVLTFQVVGADGTTYKPYASRPFKHSLNTIRRVFSIEIALRRDTMDRGLRWDERFGLNARFPGGLEQAFMKNVLDLGLQAFYEPAPIVAHPPDATGYRHTPESALFRGATYAKLYGALAYPLLAVFAVKNAWRAGSLAARARYTGNLYRGARAYLKS